MHHGGCGHCHCECACMPHPRPARSLTLHARQHTKLAECLFKKDKLTKVLDTRPRTDTHLCSRHLPLSLCRIFAARASRKGGQALAPRRFAARRWRVTASSAIDTALAICVGARLGGRARLCRCRGVRCSVVDTFVEVRHGCSRSFVWRLAYGLCLLFGGLAHLG